MEDKKENSYLIVIALLLIIGISIGYAAIATTLNINGTSTISKSTWDIHFANIQIKNGSVQAITAPSTSSSTTALSYEVNLVQPGDFYEFTVDVTNAGTINAKLSDNPLLGGVNNEQDVYTNYTVTYVDGSEIKSNDTLNAGNTVTLKVKVEFDTNIMPEQLPEENASLDLTFAMSYVQAF